MNWERVYPLSVKGYRQGRCSEYRYGGALFQNTAISPGVLFRIPLRRGAVPGTTRPLDAQAVAHDDDDDTTHLDILPTQLTILAWLTLP